MLVVEEDSRLHCQGGISNSASLRQVQGDACLFNSISAVVC